MPFLPSMKRRRQQIEGLCKDLLQAFTISLSITLIVSAINFAAESMGVIKVALESIIYVSCIFHFCLYLFDFPIYTILFSLSIQISLNILLKTFPVINIKSVYFYYSMLGIILNFIIICLKIVQSNCSQIEAIIGFLITSISPISILYYLGNQRHLRLKKI